MKRIITLIVLLVIIQTLSSAQSRKKSKERFVYASTSLNFTPPVESYSFFSSFTSNQDLFLLKYLTPTSGTFVIDEDNLTTVDRELITTFPSQLVNMGASIQIVTSDALFHELSLTKLSLAKSSYINKYTFQDSTGDDRVIQLGYEQNTAVIGIRYELGKYLGKRKKANVKFGISGAIAPCFYRFKRKPVNLSAFPITANIFTLNIALIPMLSAKLSKKLFLEFKIIPNILIADFEKIIEVNPTLSPDKRAGIREYNLPEINVGGSIQLKYLIKEPKKRKRKAKEGN